MSYEFYKLIHLIGLFLVISGLVGLLTIKMSSGKLEGQARKLVFISHGVGLVFILVSGFGLLARLQMTQPMPNWVYIKIVIWLIFGGAMTLIKRKLNANSTTLAGLLILFIIAGYIAINKPF